MEGLELRIIKLEAQIKSLNYILSYLSVMNTAIFVCLLGILLNLYL